MTAAKKQILVTGGAGYIGSHCVRALVQQGFRVLVVDNLSNGHVESIIDDSVQFTRADISDSDAMTCLFEQNDIAAVIHFAAFAYVGESVKQPLKYYQNNMAATLPLLQVMQTFRCQNIVFSSTCATYGEPVGELIREQDPQKPINPYGTSKLMVEQVIRDCGHAWGLKYMLLRYFNASGCSADGRIGEDHRPETHLIPRVLMAARGDLPQIDVFGHDYPTADGTCVRDYIHVEDLVSAHLMALDQLLDGCDSNVFNLGTGQGVSVKQVIDAASRITGVEIPVELTDRRPGDPPFLVADAAKANNVLGWHPEGSDIEHIIRTAWAWFGNSHKGRYPS